MQKYIPNRLYSKYSIKCISDVSNSLYVTSPIFYVNAKPHLGHLYSMLLCDVRKRWSKLDPTRKTFLLTGTDEHGLKIQNAAAKANMTPKQLTDKVSENFLLLAKKANIQYDRFIRTTDIDHVETVKNYWRMMEEKGLVYQGFHSGWYAISDETFYPENQVIDLEDSKTKKMIKVSKETGSEVVYQNETNYFFRLSAFQEPLIEFLEANEDFISPKSKYDELLKELKSTKLQDLSVSRPSSRLSWGIEVPGDPSQKIYVWFDALLNYLTASKFPKGFNKTQNGKYISTIDSIWPPVHVIGKDIIRFHCIYWPVFLMAAGIELPRKIVVHSHWLCDGVKMSKSLGNVVDPFDTIDYYGVDPLRFFLCEFSTLESDCNYQERGLFFTREKIIGKFANLISRCCGSNFNIPNALEYYEQNKFDEIDDLIKNHSLGLKNSEQTEELIRLKNDLLTRLSHLPLEMEKSINEFDTMKAIQSWWSVVEIGNQVFQLGQPWLYLKALGNTDTDSEVYKALMNFYIFLAADLSRIASILISPVIPELSKKLLDKLKVSGAKRTIEYVTLGSDLSYGGDSNKANDPLPITRIPMRKSS